MDFWPNEDSPIPPHELITLNLIARHLSEPIPFAIPYTEHMKRLEDNQKRFDEDWIVKSITSKYPSIKFRLTYFDGLHMKHFDRLVW